MRIVDADINALKRTRARGRVRSQETRQMIEAIDDLGPGKAKAVIVEPGQDPAKVRARLMYAAKIVGRRLRVVVENDRILFARGPGRPRKTA